VSSFNAQVYRRLFVSHLNRGLAMVSVWAILAIGPLSCTWADEFDDPNVRLHIVTKKAEAAWAQIDNWLLSGQFVEAIEAAQQLADESTGRLVAKSSLPGNLDFPVTYFEPVQDAIDDRLSRWQVDYPEAFELLRRRNNSRVEELLREADLVTPIRDLQRLALLARLSDLAPDALLLLGDAQLIRGHFASARGSYESAAPGLRAQLSWMTDTTSGSLPWYLVLSRTGDQSTRQLLQRLNDEGRFKVVTERARLSEFIGRMIRVSVAEGNRSRAEWELRFLTLLTEVGGVDPQPELTADLEKCVAELAGVPTRDQSASDLSTSDGASVGVQLPEERIGQGILSATLRAPAWTQSLARLTGSFDATPANLPRLGEQSQGLLCYYPQVTGSADQTRINQPRIKQPGTSPTARVFVHELTGIQGYELSSGQSWPTLANPIAVSQMFSGEASSENFIPTGYPIVGSPVGQLQLVPQSMDGDILYARMGSPITGWKNAPDFRTKSASALVALDLKQDGKLLDGFPIELSDEAWPTAEFEGQPITVGDRLLAVVSQRDSVQVRRYVACFDRWNGRPIWTSPILAAGLPEGLAQANLISNITLSQSEGRLFCCTDLGAIVALNVSDGSLIWATKYPRTQMTSDGYPQTMRFRFRKNTPPWIESSIVYCLPADCSEMLALDWSNGELLWSTRKNSVVDAKDVLGSNDRHLILGGDRLIWLDKLSGQVAAAWPCTQPSAVQSAIAEPRGLGRGTLSKSQIFWPIEGGVLVFATDTPRDHRWFDSVVPLAELMIGERGREGANLLLTPTHLIVATPSRLMAYAIDSINERLAKAEPVSIGPLSDARTLNSELGPKADR
jgi:hypothetical protein